MFYRNITFFLICFLLSFFLFSCANNFSDTKTAYPLPSYTGPNRTFTTSFETIPDFDGFYIVPQDTYDSTQDLLTEQVYDGTFSHKAWILRKRADSNDGLYLPHRAYPTIQFQKTADGIYRTPCLVSMWVYLDITLTVRAGIDDWFSFITLSPDTSDNWARTVVVNITPDGYIRLVHVPNQGEQDYIYQVDSNVSLQFPYAQWVRLDLLINFDSEKGYAKLWQNGTLISHAAVNGGNSGQAQAHFGLYASAAIESGTIFNDKLRIIEVSDEVEALLLVNGLY